MFADIELIINRPQDTLLAIKNKIIANAQAKYKDASIELLHQSCKDLQSALDGTETKIQRFKEKSLSIENNRAEYLKTWNSFTKGLEALCKKHKINLDGVSVPNSVGLEFAEQIMNSNPNIATFDSKKIPKKLDDSKLDDLTEKLYEIKISLKICESERLKKAQILKEILDV